MIELIIKHFTCSVDTYVFKYRRVQNYKTDFQKNQKTANIPHKKYNHLRELLTSALKEKAKTVKAKMKKKNFEKNTYKVF